MRECHGVGYAQPINSMTKLSSDKYRLWYIGLSRLGRCSRGRSTTLRCLLVLPSSGVVAKKEGQ